MGYEKTSLWGKFFTPLDISPTSLFTPQETIPHKTICKYVCVCLCVYILRFGKIAIFVCARKLILQFYT